MSEHVIRVWPGDRVPPVMYTASGCGFNLLDPDPRSVRIEDVAHHLSHLCRYTGSTRRLWSVAAHCLEVSKVLKEIGASAVAQFQGLLHDAAEAYLGDLSRPLRRRVVEYDILMSRVEDVVWTALGVPRPFDPLVQVADDCIIEREVAALFPPGHPMWERYGVSAVFELPCRSPEETRKRFLERFAELTSALRKESNDGEQERVSAGYRSA